MPLAIVDRTFNAAADRAAQFGNVEMYRPMSIGVDWSTLALGIHVDIEASGNVTLGATGFGFGLSQDVPFMQTSTSHCIGVRIGANTADLAAASNFFAWSAFDFFTKVATTTTPTNKTADVYVPHNGAANLRACFVFVCQKDNPSAGTYTVNFIRPTANTIADTTEANFLTALETLDVTNCIAGLGSSGAGYGTTSDTLTVDETTNGSLTAVNIWWPSVSSNLNMFMVAAAKWD